MAFGYLIPTNGFTMEVWFKRDTLPASFETMVNQRTQAAVRWNSGGGAYGVGRQFIMEMTPGGNLSVTIVDETATSGTVVLTWTDVGGPGYGNDNQWHHFVLRLGSNRIAWTVFLDGAVYASGNTSAAVDWNPGILTIGAQYDPSVGDFGSWNWSKWLAYPAAFNYPLSNNRIFEHYTAGSGGTVYYGDDEVTRLHRICDWADVPDQSREFEYPVVNLQGIQVEGTNALQALQDTSESSSGLVFSDGQSRVVYHNRRHSYNRWSVATMAESFDAAPEAGVTFTIDTANIYNDIRGDRPFGSKVRLVDDASKAAYGRKTFSFSISVTTQEELENAVSWLAAKYREAVIRVSSVSFRAESSDLIEWVGTGGVTVGDHIGFDELPSDSAPEVSMEFVVEKVGLDVNIKNREYIVNLELSPFELNEVFTVGVSNLGSRWKIGY